jgi:uncharacterized protein YndB with AHSA1/START domain
MSEPTAVNSVARSVTLEKDMPHPPEKIWRALTDEKLIEEWMMKNDLRPVVGHAFKFRAEPVPHWDGIVDCEVLAVEPDRRLAYSWNTSDARGELKTVVTWTLMPVSGGTHVRMEQSDFRPEQENYYRGATYGWQRFFAGLERVLNR